MSGPHAGGPCPQCGYTPIYDDAGILSCVGCNEAWDLAPESPVGDHDDEGQEWDCD